MAKFITKLSKDLKSKKVKAKILFTEGWNKTIQEAAIQLKKEGIVEPVLLFEKNNNIKSIKNIEQIIMSDIKIDSYAKTLYEIRKHKNLSMDEAKKLSLKPNYFSALLLHRKKVDGVVCGIEYTTKDTLRAALQVIGKNKKAELVSSIMFMEKSNDILMFADVSLNLNPNSKELASIAIESAKFSNKILNKKITTALLSYSTNGSGTGESVDKVREAYNLIKNKKIKNIEFFGEIQFDAAINKNVRNKKVKSIKWDKDANLFIFPNLDSANIGYKIMERLCDDVVAIGPVVIGLNKPMNDLSRGASVEASKSIAYITAFQSVK
ncbi:MAG: phosphate acetyltransferase [Mycoplasmoidaceae bacterium]